MNNDGNFQKFQKAFDRVVEKYNGLRKRPMDYGTGHVLFPSETDCLVAVGSSPGIRVTDLATKLRVTKGAASQSIAKLVQKGLVTRSRDPKNMKVAPIRLTKNGERALQYHLKFKAIYHARIGSELEKLTSKEQVFLQTWLQAMETAIDEYLDALG
jgi:DNA-binding MarR family transcriptional regulator